MKSFVNELVELWTTHEEGLEERQLPFSEAVFLHRVGTNARLMFGDLARQLDWEVRSLDGKPIAYARLRGSKYTLEYVQDLTHIYVFRAWRLDSPAGEVTHHIDSRLKLAAVLAEERRESENG